MRFVRSAALLTVIVLPASLFAQKQSVTAPGVNATATLTPGIREGNILYVSGQLGVSRDAPDSTIQGQTKRALENVQKIVEAAGNGMYRIALDGGRHETLGYLSGKMRRYRIRIVPGDQVRVKLSAYDLTRGRIVYRERTS